MDTNAHDIRAVLDFWFAESPKRLWFNSTPEFDTRIRERFETLWLRGLAGELEPWAATPDGALALIILLDQFPLNMYREDGRRYATEALSRRIADQAIARGWDADLSPEKKAFLYMPFMHSESIEDQERSVQLFGSAGLEDNLRWARHHRDIIARFGRFPHRNVALGRPTRPEEQEWLDSDAGFAG